MKQNNKKHEERVKKKTSTTKEKVKEGEKKLKKATGFFVMVRFERHGVFRLLV